MFDYVRIGVNFLIYNFAVTSQGCVKSTVEIC